MHLQLPRDVWLYMGQFIPDDDLRNLITVNGAFFHLGMNARYRTVLLYFLGEREMKWLIRLMDPLVAERVRVLCLHRIVITTSVSMSTQKGLSRLSTPKEQESLRYSSTPEGVIQALVDAVSCWSNLKEFSVKCGTSVQRIEPILRAGWSAFGLGLEKLSIAGTLDSIQALVSSSQRLPSLRELHIRFDDYSKIQSVHVTTLVDLLPFITSISPTLESLSITSWQHIDFSQFFLDLGTFPRLRHFSLRTIFHHMFSTSPDGLTLFLRRQSHTLRSVGLELSSLKFLESEESLCWWIESTMLDPLILTNLNALDFPVTQSDAGFQAFLALLQRSVNTLTELTIRGRRLTNGDVKSVISMFSPRPCHMRLVSLVINVRTLSLQLLDLFARELPFLTKLGLYIMPDGDAEISRKMDGIRNGLRTHTYPNWRLRDLGIWIGDAEIDGNIMTMLARSIPSLQSFWGRPRQSTTSY